MAKTKFGFDKSIMCKNKEFMCPGFKTKLYKPDKALLGLTLPKKPCKVLLILATVLSAKNNPENGFIFSVL